jgi:DNA polymerase III delta prime subunit
MAFKKAVKSQAKLRVALTGPAGSGKTYSALVLAKALGGRTALADSEHGSASKYSDVFEFDTTELEEFSLDSYLRVISEAAAGKYDVLVLDSISHAWTGKGGALEEVDARGGNNKFTNGWKAVTPKQNAFVDSMLAYPGHLIATMRTKMAYEIEDANGKKVPKKVGLAPVQREGVEYEFDVIIDLGVDGTARVTKTRCSALHDAFGKYDSIPKWGETLRAWVSSGVAPAPKPQPQPVFVPDAAEQYLVAFREASDLSALKRLGERLVSEPESVRAAVRVAYGKRTIELTNGAQQ